MDLEKLAKKSHCLAFFFFECVTAAFWVFYFWRKYWLPVFTRLGDSILATNMQNKKKFSKLNIFHFNCGYFKNKSCLIFFWFCRFSGTNKNNLFGKNKGVLSMLLSVFVLNAAIYEGGYDNKKSMKLKDILRSNKKSNIFEIFINRS